MSQTIRQLLYALTLLSALTSYGGDEEKKQQASAQDSKGQQGLVTPQPAPDTPTLAAPQGKRADAKASDTKATDTKARDHKARRDARIRATGHDQSVQAADIVKQIKQLQQKSAVKPQPMNKRQANVQDTERHGRWHRFWHRVGYALDPFAYDYDPYYYGYNPYYYGYDPYYGYNRLGYYRGWHHYPPGYPRIIY
ncbi:hypothetical protein HY546_03145 [archaeon]|nr:hypothetical protein [archaeon]